MAYSSPGVRKQPKSIQARGAMVTRAPAVRAKNAMNRNIFPCALLLSTREKRPRPMPVEAIKTGVLVFLGMLTSPPGGVAGAGASRRGKARRT